MNCSVVLVGEEEPFEAILEHSINLKGIDIIGIVSSRKGLVRAKKIYERIILKPISFPLYDYEDIEKLPDSFDYLINVFSVKIIGQSILNRVRRLSLNIHPGLLPDYAGLHVHQWAIREMQEYTGCTIHEMKNPIDYGDIYNIEKISISPKETGLSLYTKLSKLACEMGKNLLTKLSKNPKKFFLTPQDISRRRFYTKKMAYDSKFTSKFSFREFDAFFRACDYRPFRCPTYKCLIPLMKTKLQIEPLSYSKIEKDKMNLTKSNNINLENVLSGKPIFFTIKDSILIVKTYRVCDKNN